MHSPLLTLNDFYARAHDKDLVRNLDLRMMLANQTSPNVGVILKVIADYDMANMEKRGIKHNAYAATLLFPTLSIPEYEKLAKQSVDAYGFGKKAELHACNRLLTASKHEPVLLTCNEPLLNRLGPVACKIPGLGKLYGGGDLGPYKGSDIARVVGEIMKPVAFESMLDGEATEYWKELDRKPNPNLLKGGFDFKLMGE